MGIKRKSVATYNMSGLWNGDSFYMCHEIDIIDILAAVDFLVVPSLLEGFPMITLEAMAMAKPIVATRIDGITEQITDGVNRF